MGKSAIAAKYVSDHKAICYFNLSSPISWRRRAYLSTTIASTNLPNWGQAAEIASPYYISTISACT